MPDVVLNDVTNTQQVSVINSNFDKIETQLNDFAIDRTDVGVLESDIDMNGNRIYNLPQPVLDNEPVRLIDLRNAGTGGGEGGGSVVAGVSSFNSRAGAVTLTQADVNSALGFTPARTNSPTFSGVPTVPTPVAGTNTSQIASTAFVQQAVSGSVAGVSSFNSRTGAVTLNGTDITNSLGFTPAPLASPAFSGIPTGPTAANGTNTTQLATTAFVQNQVAASTAGVSAFNTRTGNVTLTGADVTTALTYTPANIASPSFTGTPTAPTPITSDDSTKLATTAFVKAAVSGSTAGVSSFNSRTGAVALNSTDVTNALTATSTTKNLVWPNSGTESNIYMRREATYTGGNLGFVYGAMYLETYTPTGTHNSFEWGFTSVLHSRSIASNVGGSLGVAPQNVAVNGTVFRTAGNASVWAGNFAAYHNATEYNGSQGALHGVEINVGGNGSDINEQSIGVFVVPQLQAAAPGPGFFEGWTGIWIIGDQSHTARFKTGITNQAGSIRGYHDRGIHQVGIDLSDSANSDSAIRIRANEWISFNNSSSVKMRYNSSSGRIEFFGNGAGRGFIDVVSGANVDLASGGGGGGSFVDLSSNQTVNGIKTFGNAIVANGGLITNEITISASNTINWISGGNISGTSGSLNGYLRIKIDGSTFKIPFYNP